ncbi:hypothetical protein ACFQJD_09715 [Haloplanus sp. GCM10025708]|uniref:hypothetical protein n=1 Tax=Haloplanus sp. GCM10025708 TaxID=3252679 RepID=UPI0036103BB4
MSEGDPADVIELVRRRRGVLGALESGEARKEDLVDRLDVSRSTVDRGYRISLGTDSSNAERAAIG